MVSGFSTMEETPLLRGDLNSAAMPGDGRITRTASGWRASSMASLLEEEFGIEVVFALVPGHDVVGIGDADQFDIGRKRGEKAFDMAVCKDDDGNAEQAILPGGAL